MAEFGTETGIQEGSSLQEAPVFAKGRSKNQLANMVAIAGSKLLTQPTPAVLHDYSGSQCRDLVCRRITPKLRPPKANPCSTRPVTLTLLPFPGTPKFWLKTQMLPLPSFTWYTPFPSAPNESATRPEMVISLPAKRPGSVLMCPMLVWVRHPARKKVGRRMA